MDVDVIFKKLRISNSQKSLIINAPESYIECISSLNYDDFFEIAQKGSYDFVQLFATTQAELERLTLEVSEAGKYDCIFWLCYPKGGGSIKSDIKRDTTWSIFSLIGLRPVTQIAIDDTWSALRGRPSELVSKNQKK